MKFEGIMPALVTPLNLDESLNAPVLDKLIEDLVSKEVNGFYIGGATGEGLALRPEVRRELAERSIEAVKGRVPCIVQVAATDFSAALELAKHAEDVGADAISATPPLFFGYNEEDVYAYYKALADSVHIPLMIYYNPAAGFTINAQFAARMFQVDNITAIKWTSSDYYGMMQLKNLTHGQMNVINGPDEMLLMGLNAGADGGIGTSYNFMPELFCQIYKYFISGDMKEAQRVQRKVASIIDVLKRYPIIPATKIVLEAMGYEVGNATFPMKRYDQSGKDEIIDSFRALIR